MLYRAQKCGHFPTNVEILKKKKESALQVRLTRGALYHVSFVEN